MTFRVLGLAEEAERVYITLIRNPHATTAQLAAATELPVPAVARLLSRLVQDGLIARANGRPPRFSAAAPDTVISSLIGERERELTEARNLVHTLAEAHREARRINDPDTAVELLANRDDVSAAARRLSAVAQHQVRAFDRPPYVDRPGSNLQNQLGRQRDGVAHRVIYDRTAVSWPGRLVDDILPSIRTGELSRVHADLPLKLVIADDRTAIIPFSFAPGGQSAAYLVHPSPLLTALEALFEAYWERATWIAGDEGHGGGQATGDADGAPDKETRSLLTLLAAGLSDAAVARAQGWSERTTQRRIQHLMSLLGATTRFQASLIATRRGWL
jgi:DNA-binding CsgD family transcriptional regulator